MPLTTGSQPGLTIDSAPTISADKRRRIMRAVIGILVVLAVVAGVAGFATYSYNLGIAQGLAQHGGAPAPGPGAGPGGPGAVPYPMYAYPASPYGYPFHGPSGFGCFGLPGPILFISLLFALARGLSWRAYGHRCGRGGGRAGPPRSEEWRRRARAQPKQS